MIKRPALYLSPIIILLAHHAWAQSHYQSFSVSTYATQGTVQAMIDGRLDAADSWAKLTRNLKVDKIYLEVMRNRTLVDEAGLEKLKKFFQDRGVRVCGGLAYSVSESNGYQGFDYADPDDRAFVQKAMETAARHFDEVLLDDYYFFDRKTDADIKAKGDRTWTRFRLDTMREVTENLIVKPAKAVNPKCRVVVKMANWYDQYHGMGNDTEKVPFLVEGMFAGTESRQWVGQEQHLQPYLSYDIMRFMDNLKPGVNGGGWVDQGGAVPIDRYAEQLLDTVFARCPEMCCFNYGGMIQPVRAMATQSRDFADAKPDLDLNAVAKTLAEGQTAPTFADIAGYTLARVDPVLANVGRPTGIQCYTPYHAPGDEFLHDYLGMIGLPMDIHPYFPADADMVLLTEQAAADKDILRKIKTQLEAGKSVCVTSNFVRVMKGRGIDELCEIEATGNSIPVRRFAFAGGPGAPRRGRGSSRPSTQPTADPFAAARDLLIPEIKYFNILTHDAWGDVLGVSPGGTTYPLLLSCDYSKGKLYVLAVPNDPADLYALPPSVLTVLRATLAGAEPVRIDAAPARVALFRYDNGAFIVQNFASTPAEVSVSLAGAPQVLHDLFDGKPLAANANTDRRPGPDRSEAQKHSAFSFTVPPHAYAAYSATQPK